MLAFYHNERYNKAMEKNFDYKRILDLVNNLSNCSDITVTFSFDKEFLADREVFSLPPTKTTNSFDLSEKHYCRMIEKTPYYLECGKSDEFYKQKAKKERKPIKYTCHAGLVEVICPIEINNEVIGYIQCGKFVDKEKKFSSVAKVKSAAQKYGINERELLSCYKDLPVVSAKKLNSTLFLLEKFIKPLIVAQICEEKPEPDEKNILLISLRNYVYEHISETITVENICKNLYIGKRKLYSILKNDSDQSIKDYILHIKMIEARYLLSYTEKSLTKIAESVGFCDYNYFSRYFKKATGVTPMAYRNQANKIIENE